MDIKPLPTSISTFRDIINGGYLYVDKTKWIYELIRYPKGSYFLSRPRRFGKSLLISTLDEIFQGNRELFKGLWLDDSPYEWKQHPIIRIDFGRNPIKSAQELEQALLLILKRIARQYSLTLSGDSYIEQFDDLIFELSSQNQVVILIDEYDKPILDNIENTAEAEHIRDVLKRFYGVIKAMDAYVRFVLLTGISKFSRVGVFSDLNTLNDLTLHPRFATLLGMTQSELEDNFEPYLMETAVISKKTIPDLLTKIQLWYNGFRFSKRGKAVYNPFSLMRFFDAQDFQNYWFESGTPTFLINLINTRNYELSTLDNLQVKELGFSTYEIESLAIIPLLFQTGYLTIKEYTSKNQRYHLSYPNYEVEHAFLFYLLAKFGHNELALTTNYLGQLVDALLDASWTQFFTILNTFLANIPYDIQIKDEKYYQSLFYLIFKLIGLDIHAEVRTNQGRIDAVLETADTVYIFEFKLDGSAEDALKQIKQTRYFAPYLLQDKTRYLIGVNFEMEKRGVGGWKVIDDE